MNAGQPEPSPQDENPYQSPPLVEETVQPEVPRGVTLFRQAELGLITGGMVSAAAGAVVGGVYSLLFALAVLQVDDGGAESWSIGAIEFVVAWVVGNIMLGSIAGGVIGAGFGGSIAMLAWCLPRNSQRAFQSITHLLAAWTGAAAGYQYGELNLSFLSPSIHLYPLLWISLGTLFGLVAGVITALYLNSLLRRLHPPPEKGQA